MPDGATANPAHAARRCPDRRSLPGWADNRPAAPGAIAEDLEQGYALIAAHPRIGAAARSPRLRGVRRILLDRINYYVYYRETPEAIDVLAFWHASRGAAPPL